MRLRALVQVVATGLFYGLSAAAGDTRDPAADADEVRAALDEPADPDDADDILADDDPDDVGQEGLDPATGAAPAEPATPGGDPDRR